MLEQDQKEFAPIFADRSDDIIGQIKIAKIKLEQDLKL